ncbi:MAG: MFS transporter [Phenylobacterium sp. RIFCSPHIGHO2_01_FULL_69_31]|uniref:DHA2 family efflux MFS transporter permease subunit n=1 Tax=Phenylobacterium sp. RIFCSPHIGHO2_01_FULL_69_31 TaxID=1801944 RepID=UPI0008AFC020|nr:DHA2 family efflux MFS transporter permease subunit [Phenylobacterium sp. RIFCSPHIGHO2_01_FULL_69_31]OHB29637.1 MAG: MFS transporter [Phenylobacterium sp. RIFCSPHIGHO2_01_FULL_69_31]
MTDAVLPPDPARARKPEAPAVLGADGSHVDWVKVFLGFGGMVIGQFMAMLDIQIVASSLVQIQSGIGATADEISWVQTIYLLAEVVIMPLTAYLTKMWGTRSFYVIAVIGFIATSVAVGLSSSVAMMIVFRALQGLFAGAMIPPVFATAMTVFPPERRITANVIVGLIVTLSSTIGPTLGGHLTDLLSWRWLFFINIPVGMLVIFLVGRYANFDKGDPSLSRGIDWWGLGLMTVFLLSMQYVLEEGSSEGWFEDGIILWLTVLAVLTGVAFIWRQLTYWQPIVSLAPFRDRNFSLGIVMTFVTGVSLFGGTFLMPIFLGQVRGFSSAEVGNTMLVSGLTMFLSAPIAGRFVRMVDARIAMIGGFALAAWAIQLGVRVTDEWGFNEFFVLQVARGLGTMVAMIAAQQMSVASLPVTMMKDASGLINLVRNVAGAIGLAMLTTILSHQGAIHYMDLASAAGQANASSAALLDGLTAMMTEGGVADPEGTARKAMSAMLHRQAAVLSFGDAFAVLALACWVAVGLAFFARPGPAMPGPSEGGGH